MIDKAFIAQRVWQETLSEVLRHHGFVLGVGHGISHSSVMHPPPKYKKVRGKFKDWWIFYGQVSFKLTFDLERGTWQLWLERWWRLADALDIDRSKNLGKAKNLDRLLSTAPEKAKADHRQMMEPLILHSAEALLGSTKPFRCKGLVMSSAERFLQSQGIDNPEEYLNVDQWCTR